MRRGPGSAVALGVYALAAFLIFGLRVALRSGGETYVGTGADPHIFVWDFAWWPHAILHGENPFVTHAIWAPEGLNLTWTTSVPALALLFSPLTLLFGALTSYNIAAVLLPALAAWTAFLLCRHLTGSFWPSLAGGYLFGFSSYMLGQQEGHPHMTSVFLVPLVALVVVRFLEGTLGGRGLVVRLGPLFALQLGFSVEVAFTLGLALVVGLALLAAVSPRRRPGVRAILAPLAGAVAVAAVLASPFLFYAAKAYQSTAIHPPENFVADLLNVVVPTRLEALGTLGLERVARSFSGGNDSERVAYLGLPALAIVVWYALGWRRSAAVRFLLVALALVVVAALGSALHIDGRRVVWLPWDLLDGLPFFDNVLPARLMVYATLALALIVALWSASRAAPRAARVILPLLAVLALLPNPEAGVWASTVHLPPFFTDGAYRTCLGRGETVLPLPVSNNGASMLWQVESGFWFPIAGGYMTEGPPKPFAQPPAVAAIANNVTVPADRPDLVEQYVRLKHVGAIVVDDSAAPDWRPVLDRIASPQEVGGVVVYRPGGAPPPPGCVGP